MRKGHYSYADRLAIENMLNDGHSIKEIEKDIKRDSSNIIREISKHVYYVYPSIYGDNHPCLKWKTCNVRCMECYRNCKNIEYKICPKLLKSPHVCNGCTTKGGCRFVKKYYKAREAHDDYKNHLSCCRTGLHYSTEEMIILKEGLCPLIIRTKSVYHAVITINSNFNVTFNKWTIYKQVERKQLPISTYDLPRSRKKSKIEKRDKSYKRDIEGRTYEDYEKKKNLMLVKLKWIQLKVLKKTIHQYYLL